MILEKIESIQDVAILYLIYLLNYRKVRIDREKRRKIRKEEYEGICNIVSTSVDFVNDSRENTSSQNDLKSEYLINISN